MAKPATAKSAKRFLAHVRQQDDGSFEIHDLEDHLRAVAKGTEAFAKGFGANEWGHLAGLWHDLGKYSHAFQSYISRKSGFDPEAHIEGGTGRVNHSSAGALHAVEKLGSKGRLLAYLIAGHHAGLPDWYSDKHSLASLSQRLTENHHLQDISEIPVPEDISQTTTIPMAKPLGGTEGLALWLRMLFSCLVDSDFLDTEVFMDGQKAEVRGGFSAIQELLERLNDHMEKLTVKADLTPVNRVRAAVLRQCRDRATDEPGIFSLTVPTGGGKTLSSLTFALRHASQYKKHRIISLYQHY